MVLVVNQISELVKVFTTVRLKGETYTFFYSYIVFFITDFCCLCVGVFLIFQWQ